VRGDDASHGHATRGDGDAHGDASHGHATRGDGAEVGRRLGERLRAAVAAGDSRPPHGVRGRASVGVAVSGAHADPATLLCEADMAMYQAKQAGGDTVVVTADVGAQLRPPRDLAVRTVPQALAAGELLVVYQPIVRIDDLSLAAVEALVRWQHPHLGLLSPGRFLPGAEQAGHLPLLDRWVLDRACAEQADWVRQLGGLAPARVNVNVSVPTIGRPGLDRMVLDAAARAGVAPHRLRIELPERADLAALTDARQQLERLRQHGVAVALDDMGAGASTLRHLSLPAVTELKIDRSFVAGLVDNDRDRAVIRLLADLGHTLGLGITAEGVERADQLAELERLGVGYAQGYHLGRPLLADQLAAAVESGRWQPCR
jgi:EAL domain-containing protein (putative c-di-GMP-specific phosphodiesterase class I)